jgi:hypothetical protein
MRAERGQVSAFGCQVEQPFTTHSGPSPAQIELRKTVVGDRPSLGRSRLIVQLPDPCPGTGPSRGACLGYVIDHIVPLCTGGADHPSNMQWQTAAEAVARDARDRGQSGSGLEYRASWAAA